MNRGRKLLLQFKVLQCTEHKRQVIGSHVDLITPMQTSSLIITCMHSYVPLDIFSNELAPSSLTILGKITDCHEVWTWQAWELWPQFHPPIAGQLGWQGKLSGSLGLRIHPCQDCLSGLLSRHCCRSPACRRSSASGSILAWTGGAARHLYPLRGRSLKGGWGGTLALQI